MDAHPATVPAYGYIWLVAQLFVELNPPNWVTNPVPIPRPLQSPGVPTDFTEVYVCVLFEVTHIVEYVAVVPVEHNQMHIVE